ncbi:hypothetical protein [Shewanella youngdeokensis]|uniref:Uncharacterized protein n=1 Tax=Shewanella youngdeokensis TaxID=2999068 RepID=A0ABZ0JZ46_9GAMM|nr:hypothetical protein RGE70_01720 [Shewanella sp. DAU334]
MSTSLKAAYIAAFLYMQQSEECDPATMNFFIVSNQGSIKF